MPILNQIKKKLIAFFESHKCINEVVYNNEFDFFAERRLKYPVVNIDYIESNLQEKFTTHSYMIKIADGITVGNPASEDEILSDALQVVEDLYTHLYEDYSFEVIKSSSVQPFSDSEGDRVSGIAFRLNLSVFRAENRCEIPAE